MAMRTGLALAALGAVLCAGVLWFALSPTDAPSKAAEPPHHTVTRVVDDAASALEQSEDAARTARLDATTTAIEAPVEIQPNFDASRAIWVEGRVIFAPGTPADERAVVVAWYSHDDDDEPQRASVADDGAFRVAFPAGTAKGWLGLEARYSYLHSSVDLWLDEAMEPLVLEPELGGCVRARFVMPAGAETRAGELVGTRVQAYATGRVRAETESGNESRARRVKDPSLVEIGGLVPGLRYMLTGMPKAFPPFELYAPKPEPGVMTTLDIPLELGVTLRGQVVDEAERPIAGATFLGTVAKGNDAAYIKRDDGTGADGAFTLTGVSAGRIWLTAAAPQHLAARVAIDVADGSAPDRLRFVLKRGRSIMGRVELPSGQPAANAKLSITLKQSMDAGRQWEALGWNWEARELTAGADGTFEIHGLTEGPFEILARAAAPAEDGSHASARASAVESRSESGGEPIVLKLDSGTELSGRVVDDLGRAVPRFHVEATPVGRDSGGGSDDDDLVRGKRIGDDGHFVLAGLRAGAWRIVARGNGGVVSIEATSPSESALEMLLPRAASVSGTVLDAMSQPVRGARVMYSLETTWNQSSEALATSKPTDEKGAFTLEAVGPGAGKLIATHRSFAPSASVRVDFAPGDRASNVVVMLPPSGKLTGEILGAEGRPDPLRSLYAYGSGEAEGVSFWGESDAEGRFEFEGLSPGTYSLQTQANVAEREAIRAPDGRQDWTLMQNVVRRAQVTVTAGETAHVVLGEPPRAPVRVRGIVTRRGRPLGGAQIMAIRSGGKGGAPEQKTATTKDDGNYELVVGEPGLYWFRVGAGSRGTSAQRQETIPEGAEHTIDFDLPAGRIAGRVISPEGGPMRQYQVQLQASSPRAGALTELRTNFGWMTTDEHGAFAFDSLLPGAYTVRANDRFSGDDDAGTRYGPVTSDEILIEESSTRDDVVLRLEIAGRVELEARGPGGDAIAGVEVFGFYESGKSIDVNDNLTDAAGRVRLGGLPARPVLLFARKDSLASAVTGPVRVRSGELEKVKLDLRPATMIEVVVEGPDGPRSMEVVVRDEHGIDFTSLWSRVRSAGPRPVAASGGALIGPLPPGRYRAVPSDTELEAHGVDVIVAGEAELTVRIKLPK